MNKIIIVLYAVLAIVHAGSHLQEVKNIDNYLRVVVGQQKRVLDSLDAELANFKHFYAKRVEAVGMQKELIAESIIQTEERLAPLPLLNDHYKQCVLKYRGRLAGVKATKEQIAKCELSAIVEISKILVSAVKVRDDLQSHIEQYEEKVFQCKDDECVSKLTSEANKLVSAKQKDFEYEMEAAECLAKTNVKKYVDCSYTIQFGVLTVCGEIEALINRCITGEKYCKPCGKHTCAEAINVYGDYQNQTIANPLYGRNDNPNCVMLNFHQD